jgi:hypothetical protein
LLSIIAVAFSSPRLADARIPGGGQSSIFWQVDDTYFRLFQGIQNADGIFLRRTVIDNNDLDVLKCLLQNALNCFPYKLPVVVAGNDHADKWMVSRPRQDGVELQRGLPFKQSLQKGDE